MTNPSQTWPMLILEAETKSVTNICPLYATLCETVGALQSSQYMIKYSNLKTKTLKRDIAWADIKNMTLGSWSISSEFQKMLTN